MLTVVLQMSLFCLRRPAKNQVWTTAVRIVYKKYMPFSGYTAVTFLQATMIREASRSKISAVDQPARTTVWYQ